MIELHLDAMFNDKLVEDIEGKIFLALEELAHFILQDAQDTLDNSGTTLTGHLAKSGRVEVDRAKEEVSIIFSAPYASYVEYGTRPHVAPLGDPLPYRIISRGKNKGEIRILRTPDMKTNPLDWWAWRRGERQAILTKKYGCHTELGYKVWVKIMKKGTDPHPYLRPAMSKAMRMKDKIITKAFRRDK